MIRAELDLLEGRICGWLTSLTLVYRKHIHFIYWSFCWRWPENCNKNLTFCVYVQYIEIVIVDGRLTLDGVGIILQLPPKSDKTLS